ncbi:MAG: sigma-70 family RNA polymerase sigma factor, partial [Pseudomonadota bacterium]
EHRDDLVAIAASVVRNRGLAEDIVQDAFLEFTQKVKTNNISEPYAYLVMTVRYMAIRIGRRQVVEGRIFDAKEFSEVDERSSRSNAPDPETVLQLQDDYRSFRAALDDLPSVTRRAALMYLVEELTVREIATRLSVSVGKAHAMVKDAIQHCRQQIGPRDSL